MFFISYKEQSNLLYHIIAILVVLIWGVTFVSTKVLIHNGLCPSEIFIARFIIAYLCIWSISPKKILSASWRDELMLAILGILGGSLYFNVENLAIKWTYVNDVSFIVCTCPLMTALLAIFFLKEEKVTLTLILGSVVAIIGVGLVIFNGQIIMNLNIIGKILALIAGLCWAVASLLMRTTTKHYGVIFVTRKLFFYGILTGIPFLFIGHSASELFPLRRFLEPAVGLNILFLGAIASFVCFALWTLIIKKIGTINASNYVYINPISTVIASAIFLDEPMTLLAYLGSGLILIGVFFANKFHF